MLAATATLRRGGRCVCVGGGRGSWREEIGNGARRPSVVRRPSTMWAKVGGPRGLDAAALFAAV